MKSWRSWSLRGGEQANHVNKQATIACILLTIYVSQNGWTEIVFALLVELVTREPLLPPLAFALGIIATLIRREFVGVFATCVLASIYTVVAFMLRGVQWNIVSWAEWTLIRAWSATLLFLAGSVLVLAIQHITKRHGSPI